MQCSRGVAINVFYLTQKTYWKADENVSLFVKHQNGHYTIRHLTDILSNYIFFVYYGREWFKKHLVLVNAIKQEKYLLEVRAKKNVRIRTKRVT